MIVSFVLVINHISLGRAAAMSVTLQSLGFCLLSSLITHPDSLRKSVLLLPPLLLL